MKCQSTSNELRKCLIHASVLLPFACIKVKHTCDIILIVVVMQRLIEAAVAPEQVCLPQPMSCHWPTVKAGCFLHVCVVRQMK